MKSFRSLPCALVLTLALALPAASTAASYLDLGPMLGHVGPSEARIWLKGSAAADASILIGQADDLADARRCGGLALEPSHDFMATIAIDQLAPAQRYFYAVALDGKIITPRPYPSFTTAPPAAEPARQRIAFSSCLGHTGKESAAAWAQMDAAAGADVILLLGDDHYADTTAREGQSAGYFSHRSVPAFRSITSRTPTYNIWDDHDFGPNDSDGTAVGKEASLATFKDFWPNPSYGEADNPGVYYKFSRAGVDIFMLDVRYHRSPDRMIDDGHKTMLGARQLAWFKRELKASTAKVKLVASGSEWQTHSHSDSWSSYPRERDEIFKFIADEHLTGILLISGDRHFSGGYQINGKLIEVTSGPLGSKNFPTENLPEMFFNYGEGKLYCLFDIDTRPAEPTIILEVHRAGDGIVEKIDLPWAAVVGEQQLDTLPVEVTPKKLPFQLPHDPAASPAE